MTKKQLKALIKFQKSEMDAVFMYKKLAEYAKTEERKEILLKAAADEGKHAGILHGYTETVIEKVPKTMQRGVLFAYKVFGKKLTFKFISIGEKASVKPYSKYADEFPRIKEIMADELHHSAVALELSKTKE